MGIRYTLGRSEFRTFEQGIEKEWLLTNGIGGFANQTIIGANSRIHGGYLIASLHPPVDRKLILAKTHEAVIIENKEYDLATQSYIGTKREGQKYLNRFELDVIPTYTYEVEGIQIKKSVALEYGKNKVAICYEVRGGRKESKVNITPCFNYRPFDSVSEKSQLNFSMKLSQEDLGGNLILKPSKEQNIEILFYASNGEFYDRSLKPVSMATPNYLVEENEVYPIDNRNGFLGVDNHYTPYDVCVTVKPFEHKTFYITCEVYDINNTVNANSVDYKDGFINTVNANFAINKEEFTNTANSSSPVQKDGFTILKEYKDRIYQFMDKIPYEDDFARRLAWAADAFIVDRESTKLKTIVAGYPWFTDWGRDTMIALQGLTLCTGRKEDARDILESFSRYVKNGMIPNVFAGTAKEEPGYNTIDASLWYFYSVYKYLEYNREAEDYKFIQEKIYPKLKEIITAYQNGTSYGIRMDDDYLIQGGSNYDQLTWMDVRVGDWVVTPRHGKAVEINALWYNALRVMHQLAEHYQEEGSKYFKLSEQVKSSFRKKFWNEEKGCLYDVISKEPVANLGDSAVKPGDATHKLGDSTPKLEDFIARSAEPGNSVMKEIYDDRIRPNQVYAVSLPFTMLDRAQEKQIVQTVREQLYTPYGMRSLTYKDKEYKSQYIGKLILRDSAYHMGTTWGYLSGAFISAFCKVENYSPDAIKQAKEMCEFFGDHMMDGCINAIAEIFDGDFACTSRGCYSQAWSVGEILRVYYEDILKYTTIS